MNPNPVVLVCAVISVCAWIVFLTAWWLRERNTRRRRAEGGEQS